MAEISSLTITLETAQVNKLVDIARRWYALISLVEPVAVMVDPKWESALTSAEAELRDATGVLLDIVRPAVPQIQPETLGATEFIRDANMPFGQEQAVQLAEIARAARLRSHQLRPMLSEVPGDSVTCWAARKIVDRLRVHAGELLAIVRLVDPARATLVIKESEQN